MLPDGGTFSSIDGVIRHLKITIEDICVKIRQDAKTLHVSLVHIQKLKIRKCKYEQSAPYQNCLTFFNYVVPNKVFSMETKRDEKKRKLSKQEDLSGAPIIANFKSAPGEFFHRKDRMCTLDTEPCLVRIIDTRCKKGSCPFVKCEWYVENEYIISEHAASALLMNPKYYENVRHACENCSYHNHDASWDKIDD